MQQGLIGRIESLGETSEADDIEREPALHHPLERYKADVRAAGKLFQRQTSLYKEFTQVPRQDSLYLLSSTQRPAA
jgi:hypothetical protein